MHQCYHRAVRAAVRLPAFKDVSAETHGYALRKAGLPDLAGQLRLRRLQHLGHLARAGPPELLRILEKECTVTDQSWSALVAHDLQWLRSCGGDFAEVAPVYGSGVAMVPWVAQHLRYWTGWLRRAKRFSVTVSAIEQDVIWFQRHMRQVLPECGVTFPQGPTAVTAYAHPCPDCGQAFQDAAALCSVGFSPLHEAWCSLCTLELLCWHRVSGVSLRVFLYGQAAVAHEAKQSSEALPTVGATALVAGGEHRPSSAAHGFGGT